MDQEGTVEKDPGTPGGTHAPQVVEEDWREICEALHDSGGFSSAEVGAMTRREVDWRLDMAAEKMKRRGMKVGPQASVDTKPEFTEEQAKTLDAHLAQAKARIAEEFKNKGIKTGG